MTRQRINGGLMFLIACFTNPCCAPLYVPLLLALTAGTPFAAWLSANLGLAYGGLTLVSMVSLVIGVRWFAGKRARREGQPGTEPVGVQRTAVEEAAR